MDSRLWHPITKFPVPGIKLLVKTTTGKTFEAIRPTYAQSYGDDPDFRLLSNNKPIKEVSTWSIL